MTFLLEYGFSNSQCFDVQVKLCIDAKINLRNLNSVLDANSPISNCKLLAVRILATAIRPNALHKTILIIIYFNNAGRKKHVSMVERFGTVQKILEKILSSQVMVLINFKCALPASCENRSVRSKKLNRSKNAKIENGA